MVRLRLPLLCVLAVLVAMPPAAAAGGWWSYINVSRSHVAPGQRVELHENVAFNSVAAAQEAREAGRFYVYLLRDFDFSIVERAMGRPSPREWWSLGAAEAIQVGQVAVNVSDAGFGRATAAFTVPELPPATYHLMLCSAACAEPLGDVIPAEDFTVVADPATAGIANRVDRLKRRSRNHAGRLAAARAESDKALVAARNARSEVKQLTASVSSLANGDRSAPLAGPWAYAGWLLAGALAGVLALLVLRRRPSRPPRPAGADGWQPSDAELRELVSSESSEA